MDATTGAATLLHTFRRAGVISQCAFLAYPGASLALAAGTVTGSGAGAAAAPASSDSAIAAGAGAALVATVPPASAGGCAFLFGGDAGILTYGNDGGVTADVLTGLHSAIDVLETQPQAQSDAATAAGPSGSAAAAAANGVRVVVVTRSLLLTQLHFNGADGQITSGVRGRLAVRSGAPGAPAAAAGPAGTSGIAARAWVGANALATVCPDEAAVRIWNFARDEALTITAAATASGSIPPGERLCALAAAPARGLLFAGSESGGLYAWRRAAGASIPAAPATGSGPKAVASASAGQAVSVVDAWEPIYASTLPSGVLSLTASARCGTLAIRTAAAGAASSGTAEVPLLVDVPLHRRHAGDVTVVQLSPREVSVERRGPPDAADKGCPGGALSRAPVATATIRSSMPLVRGMACSASHLLLWSGRACEIYAIPDWAAVAAASASAGSDAADASSAASGTAAGGAASRRMLPLPAPRLVGSFASPASVMAIAGDAVYAGVGGRGSDSALTAALLLPAGAAGSSAAAVSADAPASVLVHNFAGAVRSSIGLGEQDGAVVAIDASLAGKHVAVASAGGRILVYDVARVEPRQVAAGRFEDAASGTSLGRVTSLRLNSDGSRVAVLASRSLSRVAALAASASSTAAGAGSNGRAGAGGPGSPRDARTAGAAGGLAATALALADPSGSGAGSSAAGDGDGADIAVADTRLWVYTCEADRLVSWDAGPRRVPVYVAWDVSEGRQLALQTERMRGELPAQGLRERVTGAASGAASASGAATDRKEGKEADEDAGAGLARSGSAGNGSGEPDTEVHTLFCTGADRGDESLLPQDALPLESPGPHIALAGLATPHLHLLLAPAAIPSGGARVALRTLRDFADLEDVDEGARRALVDFSMHMAAGDMDAAYKAVKIVTAAAGGDGASPSGAAGSSGSSSGGAAGGGAPSAAAAGAHIWENMAALCVKTKRLDVAAVCLGHMRHARGCKAVRELANEAELEANVAQVAVQLNMLPEAARLYQAGGRYDLLRKLYVNAGQWERALAVAAKHDRVHLAATHYAYARFLEAAGDRMAAVRHYEASGAGRVEVTRMLHDAGDITALEAYCDASADSESWKWFGQYCEARGNTDAAAAWYRRARDVLSLVRVACAAGDYRGAAATVTETGDAAAAFHLARALEAAGSPSDALVFYEKAGRFNHAVRLAKASGSEAALLALARQADRPVQLDVARHFEDACNIARAVQLYRAAGALGRAVDLCFAHGLQDELAALADSDVTADTHPELLRRVADHFIASRAFDKAVSLMIAGRRYGEAASMCVSHKIEISEAMAEAMTPPKPEADPAVAAAAADAGAAAAAAAAASGVSDPTAVAAAASEATLSAAREARAAVLCAIAKALKRQGAFHLATKKYTQAGDRVKAIKALIKSGDSEKVIFFANKTRAPEVYILAANHLQTLATWHTDAALLGSIVDFYSKAKAWEQLSSFYEACAAVEIDEYRNYEKALAALREAAKHAAKIRGEIREARVATLGGRIAIVERFVAARRLAKTDMPAMAEACRALLELRDAEAAIRVGDVYALLIYYYAHDKAWRPAYELCEDMRTRAIALEPFVEAAVLRKVYL